MKGDGVIVDDTSQCTESRVFVAPWLWRHKATGTTGVCRVTNVTVQLPVVVSGRPHVPLGFSLQCEGRCVRSPRVHWYKVHWVHDLNISLHRYKFLTPDANLRYTFYNNTQLFEYSRIFSSIIPMVGVFINTAIDWTGPLVAPDVMIFTHSQSKSTVTVVLIMSPCWSWRCSRYFL